MITSKLTVFIKTYKFLILIILLYSCTRENEIVSYYETGEVRAVSPIDSDSLANGSVFYYYKNGDVESVLDYVHGQQTGKIESFYKSGNRKFKGSYLNGFKDGKFIYFYDNKENSLKGEENFVLGKENGMYRSYDEEGKLMGYGYVIDDTTKFYVVFDKNGLVKDCFSESAISPKRQNIEVFESFSLDFKVYGEKNKTTNIDYLLVNFETEDTVLMESIKQYEYNSLKKLRFKGLEKGNYFIDFYVPLLDSIYIMTAAVEVGNEID